MHLTKNYVNLPKQVFRIFYMHLKICSYLLKSKIIYVCTERKKSLLRLLTKIKPISQSSIMKHFLFFIILYSYLFYTQSIFIFHSFFINFHFHNQLFPFFLFLLWIGSLCSTCVAYKMPCHTNDQQVLLTPSPIGNTGFS